MHSLKDLTTEQLKQDVREILDTINTETNSLTHILTELKTREDFFTEENRYDFIMTIQGLVNKLETNIKVNL